MVRSRFHREILKVTSLPASFSYIIAYRSASERLRKTNLQAVLEWLALLADLEVVVVEQDRVPTLRQAELPANCSLVYMHHAGPFNKSWGLNVGFQSSTGASVAFGDADVLVSPPALARCFQACQGSIEAVKPYDRLIDLTEEETRRFLSERGALEVERSVSWINREGIGEYVSFGGGLFIMQRGTFERLGGFDERFLGWGGEDDAMTIKVQRLVAAAQTLSGQTAFHLWHPRSQQSRTGHPHYQQNVARVQYYARCEIAELLELCRLDQQALASRTHRGSPSLASHGGSAEPEGEPA